MPEESSSEEEEADDDDGNVEFVYGPPKERKRRYQAHHPQSSLLCAEPSEVDQARVSLFWVKSKVYSIKMTCCSVQIEKRSHRLNQPQRKTSQQLFDIYF